jgi:hypothetical protein
MRVADPGRRPAGMRQHRHRCLLPDRPIPCPAPRRRLAANGHGTAATRKEGAHRNAPAPPARQPHHAVRARPCQGRGRTGPEQAQVRSPHTPDHPRGRRRGVGHAVRFARGRGLTVAPRAVCHRPRGPDGIATAITTGVRPGDRILAPAMPWPGSCALAEDDPAAPVARLLSLARGAVADVVGIRGDGVSAESGPRSTRR